MRYLATIFIVAFLSACHSRQSFELAEMVENVLDEDQGVTIQITPDNQKKSK